ncbi:hypothetical protein HZA40_02355 [Candidatus Peregrinibacteria bacterium]|nr:hypothetical protein [Candidatus Peregrinibacteria bacterium]
MNKKKIFLIGGVLIILAAISFTYLEVAFGAGIKNDHAAIFSGKIKGTVDMRAEALDHDILKISVMSIDMSTPVLGMAFHLNYDGEKIKFLKYEPGDFLENGGSPFYLVQNDEKKNEIIFGETLRRGDKFPLGGGKIADFYFQIMKKEPLNFHFKQGAVSTMDTVRQDIDKIVWNDLSLDKNGRKITDEILSGQDVNSGQNVENNSTNLPANFVTMIVMGVIIVGLVVWIFINRKKENGERLKAYE